jgi:hypothetical protein
MKKDIYFGLKINFTFFEMLEKVPFKEHKHSKIVKMLISIISY